MTNPAKLKQAAFEIPLSDYELMLLGRITAIWSHIELVVDVLLRELHKIDQQQFEEFFGDKQMGNKLSALMRCASRSPHQNAKDQISAFDATITPLLTDRNHVVHGLWGHRIDRAGKIKEPAAHSHKRRETPFNSSRPRELCNRLATASIMADDLSISLLGYPPRPNEGRRFFFGPTVPEGCECLKCRQERLREQP